MRFRLTYRGQLAATNRPDNAGAKERKHAIRRQFHAQLRYLWGHTFLRDHRVPPTHYKVTAEPSELDANGSISVLDAVAKLHTRGRHRFVPLVRRDWDLACELDVLLLRHDGPGSIISGPDVDNRIKSLVDALTMPSVNQLTDDQAPEKGDDPFFCLLEDDNLLVRLNVDTDRLLSPPDGTKRPEHTQAVETMITVTVRPTRMTIFNIGFG